MKRLSLSIIIVIILSLSISTFNFAGTASTIVKVNGKAVAFNDTIRQYSNSKSVLLVSLDFVRNILGKTAQYEEASGLITISGEDFTILLRTGSNSIETNSQKKVMDSVAEYRDGVVYIPLKAVCENMGAQVSEDKTAKSLSIITKDYEAVSGYIVPKDSPNVILTAMDTGFEIALPIYYDSVDVIPLSKQIGTVTDVLSSKFDSKTVSFIMDFLKGKTDVKDGFEEKSISVHAQRIFVTAFPDKNIASVSVTLKNIEYMDPVIMEKPPFKYYNGMSVKKAAAPVKLTVKSSKSNNITDSDAWMAQNKVTLDAYQVPNPFMNTKGNIPKEIPASYKQNMLVKVIKGTSSTFLVYGEDFGSNRYLVAMDPSLKDFKYALNFQNYRYAQDYIKEDYQFIDQSISWVAEENNILYVSHRHLTYAKSSKGMNAYITAIDLSNFKVLWRSQPLVSNSSNFVISNDIIYTGYGFSGEDDYLYALNKYTGAVVTKLKIKSMAEIIALKGNSLYVRCYNTDYVLQIATGQKK